MGKIAQNKTSILHTGVPNGAVTPQKTSFCGELDRPRIVRAVVTAEES